MSYSNNNIIKKRIDIIFMKSLGKLSKSEKSGLSLLKKNDKVIFCPGVGTGTAEIRMALDNPERKIIATTIDEEEIGKVANRIKETGLSNQIELKLEDIRKPMPYQNNCFDFIYARLVLHYLSKQELEEALKELYRVLKPDGRIFIVVRSTNSPEAHLNGSTYDKKTRITTYPFYDNEGHKTGTTRRRYFHSIESISEHVIQSGFKVVYVKEYKESLYSDFVREKIAFYPSFVIEIVVKKPTKLI
jgi:ubiquinone/menaquinone biosynthesis C-methylase UbiE